MGTDGNLKNLGNQETVRELKNTSRSLKSQIIHPFKHPIKTEMRVLIMTWGVGKLKLSNISYIQNAAV